METELRKQLGDFKEYFATLQGGDDHVTKNLAARAADILDDFIKKIDGGTFSKDDANELQGALTKGIGDWTWPEGTKKEIEPWIEKLCELAYKS